MTVTWTGATTQIGRAATFPVSNEAVGQSSLSIDPQHVGDLVVVSVQEHSTTFAIGSVSGGNASSWTRATQFIDTANTLTYDVWYGVANAVGPATVQLSYGSQTPGLPIEMIADSFVLPGGTSTWSVVTSGGESNGVSGTVVWPALTSSSVAHQLYWGASEEHTTGYAGSTPGFFYNDTYNGNTFLYDPNLGPLIRVQPLSGESPVDASTAVGMVFAAV